MGRRPRRADPVPGAARRPRHRLGGGAGDERRRAPRRGLRHRQALHDRSAALGVERGPATGLSALAGERWDAEYRRGRYVDEPPLPFVTTILETLASRRRPPDAPGLYVGCGNGRNWVPLVDAGLDLYGLDVSTEALRQLAERRPGLASRLLHGDFLDFRPPVAFGYLIAIQVFQHGRQADAAAYFERAGALLAPGGLLFVRVNSASTQVFHRHAVVEDNAHGGFTVQYLDGPKQNLPVHFYARPELEALTRPGFRCMREPEEQIIHRAPPQHGFWAQWESVYERT
jgi:SAM-dependent methyltransferase